MSKTIRGLCGALGFCGVIAIAVNAVSEGGIRFNFAFFSSLMGAFIFFYVAFFGVAPWGDSVVSDVEERRMSPTKWRIFWVATVTFLVAATLFLSQKGVFEDADIVVLVMIGLLYGLVGAALYLFIRSRPEDSDWK